VRDAEVVLTCTARSRAHLGELAAGLTPVKLVYHGVDVDGAVPVRRAGHAPIVLSIGRLVAKKGHATLLRAAALLCERDVDFRLRLAGDGPEWARLQRLCRELRIDERVAFLGPLTETEVREEYERADVFALACEELASGDRDGIPNVILEAMASGLPVASTFSGSVSEAVVDGRCGLLVPQRDAEALAGALTRLIEDRSLRMRLGEQARAHVVEHFDRSPHLAGAVAALRAAGLLPEELADRTGRARPLEVAA
jgi:glycosyltransferase involved in cell wall biosynthesis